ncbi:MAG: hypothetical protein NTY30_00270 [Candidatus Berkelbacteria bacterium]|nr:hypothetical protein [Candidatus Berkelbacteria bacterium]
MPEGETPTLAPSAAPAKKSNATTIIIIVVVAVVVLGVGGTLISRWVARKAADKIAGGLLGAATGSNVSVNSDTGAVSVSNGAGTTAVGGSAQWPSTMPTAVPKFSKGTITMSSSTNDSSSSSKGWSVILSDVKQADYDAYKTTIEAAGWANTSSTSFGADMIVYENSSYDLTLVYDPSTSGLSITVTPKS